MPMRTVGTIAYFKDPTYSTVVEVACVEAMGKTGGGRTIAEVFCLNNESPFTMPGNIGAVQATMNIAFDPGNASHKRLHELFNAGTELQWAIGLSDGSSVPTLDSEGDITVPSSRSWFTFSGFVAEFPWDAQAQAVYRSNLSVSVSGPITLTPKS